MKHATAPLLKGEIRFQSFFPGTLRSSDLGGKDRISCFQRRFRSARKTQYEGLGNGKMRQGVLGCPTCGPGADSCLDQEDPPRIRNIALGGLDLSPKKQRGL